MSFQESYEARDPVPIKKARWEGYPHWRKAKRGDDDKEPPKGGKPEEDDDPESDDDSSSSAAQTQTAPPPPPQSKSPQSSVTIPTTQTSQSLTSTLKSSDTTTTTAAVTSKASSDAAKPTSTSTPTSAAALSTSSVSTAPKTTLATSVATPASISPSVSSSRDRGAATSTTPSLPLSTTQEITTSASPTALAETAAPAQTSGSAKTSKQETSSGISATANHTSLIFGGIGGGIGVALLLGLIIFLIRRRFRKHRSQHPTPNFAPDRGNATRSIWGTETLSSGRSRTTISRLIPPMFNGPNPNTNNYDNENDMAMPTGRFAAEKQDDTSTLSSYAVERQGRLDRVRTDLLADRELGFGGGLMRGKKTFQPSGREHIGDGRGLRPQERERVDIDAGGRWEEPATIAARNSMATSVSSVPRWRDPVTWAKDQARRNDSRQESNIR